MAKGLIRLEKQEQNVCLAENCKQVGTKFDLNLLASVKTIKLFQNCRHLLLVD